MKLLTTLVVAIVLVTAATLLANVVSHRVTLKHMKGDVLVVEREDGTGLSMEQAGTASLEVRTDGDGKPIEFSVVLGPMMYWDLNGDGTIDARYNKATRKPAIWIEDKWLEVQNTKDGFSSREKRSADGTARYAFQDGHWAVR